MRPDPIIKNKKICSPHEPNIQPNYDLLCPGVRLLPTPSELIAMLDRKVIGQTEAKSTLASAVYNHFLLCSLAEMTNLQVEPSSLLLVGGTGSGKSILLKSLREITGIPMIYLSCTDLTQNGYKGININEVIERIENELLEDHRTQPAIIVWDELDKLREQSHHPVSSRGVQQDLLAYLEGSRCGKSGMLDSTRFLNVGCGAFVGLDDLRKRRGTTQQIGFFAQNSDSEQSECLEPLSTQHLIEYGMIPEFIGRFSTITELAPIDAVTLRKILTEAEGNPLAVKKHLFELHGIDLRITDNALDEMVTLALKMGTGARSLKSVLQRTLNHYDFRLPELAANGVTTLTITAETVRGEEPALQNITQDPRELVKLTALRKHAGAFAFWKKKINVETIW